MSWRGLAIVTGLGAAAAAGTLIYRSYRAEMHRARARLDRGGRLAATALGAVEFAETGSGAPVLSIHGAGGGFDQGLDVARDFVGDGYRIVAPSRFGYLRTPVPSDPSDAAQADAHAALLDALNVEKVIVIGTSAGARSAIELVLRHPSRVTSLILAVPATFAPDSPVGIEGSLGSRLAFRLVSAGADFAWWALERIAPNTLMRFLGVPPALFDAASRSDKERILRIVRGVQPLSQRFRGIDLDSVAELRRPPLESLRVPTLILAARDDPFNTRPAAAFAAGAIAGAKLVVFDSGGHLLVGRQGEARGIVAEFLRGSAARPSGP